METADQGGGGGAEVNSKSVGPASYKYFPPLAQTFRVLTLAETVELRAMWWRLRRIDERLPAEAGVIVIKGWRR